MSEAPLYLVAEREVHPNGFGEYDLGVQDAGLRAWGLGCRVYKLGRYKAT